MRAVLNRELRARVDGSVNEWLGRGVNQCERSRADELKAREAQLALARDHRANSCRLALKI
eukprot:6214146-Pleurochrysis_carterae.AAC.2